MLDEKIVTDLCARFVWNDFADWGGVLMGWAQSICIATDHLSIWADFQPGGANYGGHGIEIRRDHDGACLLVRQYTDGKRIQFSASINFDKAVAMLLSGSCNKVGTAAANLIEKLEQQGLVQQQNSIDQIHPPIAKRIY